jgi:processive 1,2-diacylglycerol beta-glucosyltransferase
LREKEAAFIKVLILSITAGHGHHQTAKALQEYLQEQQVQADVLDTFEYINPVLSKTVAKGYLISTQFSPKVYGRLYRAAEKREPHGGKLTISQLISSILSTQLVTYIRDYDPDVIVCTHIFSAQIVTQLLEKNKIDAKTIGIVTDFTIHPFWEDTKLDYYVTANELLNHQAAKKGIDVSHILPMGIPIRPAFAQKMDQKAARSKLGIEDKTTVFVMSGSMGYGNVLKTIKALNNLDLDFQIISVCGNNKLLRSKIDKMEHKKKIYNFGFVDHVHVMMDASDCIVTKPGGLTMSECMAKCLPAILINPIPGQEDRNVEFLLNHGLAMHVSPTFPIDEALYQMLHSSVRQRMIKEAMCTFGKPNAVRDLGDFIIKLAAQKQLTKSGMK